MMIAEPTRPGRGSSRSWDHAGRSPSRTVPGERASLGFDLRSFPRPSFPLASRRRRLPDDRGVAGGGWEEEKT